MTEKVFTKQQNKNKRERYPERLKRKLTFMTWYIDFFIRYILTTIIINYLRLTLMKAALSV